MPLHELIYPLRVAPDRSLAICAVVLGLHVIAGVLFVNEANNSVAVVAYWVMRGVD